MERTGDRGGAVISRGFAWRPNGSMKVRARVAEAVIVTGVAAGSLWLWAAPGYDAWSWLQWGRETTRLELATDGGPAFKPLPVAVAALLAPADDAAPELWLLLTRVASLLGVLVAGRVAWRLSGGSWATGVAAAAGVVLCSGWLAVVAAGGVEGPTIALAMLAFERALDRRPRQALALGFLAALLRPEAWPLLGLYAVWEWRREPALRRAIAIGAAALPVCWLGPELLASGELLRSGERATVPNPGAPALADRPALASLERAAGLAPAPLALAGVAAAVLGVGRWVRVRAGARAPTLTAAPAALLALGGLAWIGLVAVMSEAGFSGEERYALPGAAVLAVAGAAGVGRLGASAGPPRTTGVRRSGRRVRLVLRPVPRALLATALLAAVGASTVARAGEVTETVDRATDAHALTGDLEAAVAAAGGPDRVRACGRPFVGPYRGPLLAWHLDVPKARVGFAPRAPGVVFRSRLSRRAAVSPAVDPGAPFRAVVRTGRWEVVAACRTVLVDGDGGRDRAAR